MGRSTYLFSKCKKGLLRRKINSLEWNWQRQAPKTCTSLQDKYTQADYPEDIYEVGRGLSRIRTGKKDMEKKCHNQSKEIILPKFGNVWQCRRFAVLLLSHSIAFQWAV